MNKQESPIRRQFRVLIALFGMLLLIGAAPASVAAATTTEPYAGGSCSTINGSENDTFCTTRIGTLLTSTTGRKVETTLQFTETRVQTTDGAVVYSERRTGTETRTTIKGVEQQFEHRSEGTFTTQGQTCGVRIHHLVRKGVDVINEIVISCP